MKELKDYTDEELRNELKRRAIEKRKNTPREVVYVEFEATIKEVDNKKGYYCSGKEWHKPFTSWRYEIEDWTTHVDIKYHNDFTLKQGCFKRDTAPKVGDRVKLRYRRTKKSAEIFDIHKAKIVEIVKQKNNDAQS